MTGKRQQNDDIKSKDIGGQSPAADTVAPNAEDVDREGNTLNDDGTVTLHPGVQRRWPAGVGIDRNFYGGQVRSIRAMKPRHRPTAEGIDDDRKT